MNIEEKRSMIKSFIEKEIGSKMFRVCFIKKTTGELREMTAKNAVLKYSKGGSNRQEGHPDLLTTFDMEIANKLSEEERNKAYRTINLDGVISLKSGSNELIFTH